MVTQISSDDLLAEGFVGFPQSSGKCQESPCFTLLSLISLADRMTLGASGHWLGTRKGASSIVALA